MTEPSIKHSEYTEMKSNSTKTQGKRSISRSKSFYIPTTTGNKTIILEEKALIKAQKFAHNFAEQIANTYVEMKFSPRKFSKSPQRESFRGEAYRKELQKKCK